MHHKGHLPLTFASPQQGFGGKNCQNASPEQGLGGKNCQNVSQGKPVTILVLKCKNYFTMC